MGKGGGKMDKSGCCMDFVKSTFQLGRVRGEATIFKNPGYQEIAKKFGSPKSEAPSRLHDCWGNYWTPVTFASTSPTHLPKPSLGTSQRFKILSALRTDDVGLRSYNFWEVNAHGIWVSDGCRMIWNKSPLGKGMEESLDAGFHEWTSPKGWEALKKAQRVDSPTKVCELTTWGLIQEFSKVVRVTLGARASVWDGVIELQVFWNKAFKSFGYVWEVPGEHICRVCVEDDRSLIGRVNGRKFLDLLRDAVRLSDPLAKRGRGELFSGSCRLAFPPIPKKGQTNALVLETVNANHMLTMLNFR